MESTSIAQSPYSALTFVAAPALLTNASSVLVLSTINRMLRTRESMKELLAKSDKGGQSETEAVRLIEQVNRIERQATLLLRSLHAIYVALAAFAGATLVTLLGAGVARFGDGFWPAAFAALGVVLGFVGVGGLVLGCVSLFYATQISLVNIREEAAVIRERHATRK